MLATKTLSICTEMRRENGSETSYEVGFTGGFIACRLGRSVRLEIDR